MRHHASRRVIGLASLLAFAVAGQSPVIAQDNVWRVMKMSGDAWVTASGIQSSSMAQDVSLKPGDMIRTGRNGRVLLARGAENMLVSPNSAISIPETGRKGLSTIIQQAGSILLEVEKKNVQHFEVETPYLAAVVKGTRFRVTVANGRTDVMVERGQVQVSDFRSGQFATILPGQSARVAPAQGIGLKLSGSGAFGRIEQGQPQAPRVMPLAVPGSGLRAPAGAVPLNRGDAPAIREAGKTEKPAARVKAAVETRSGRPAKANAGITRGANGSVRITAAMGEVRLDINKATDGLVSGSGPTASGSAARQTIWDRGVLNPADAVRANGGNSSASSPATARGGAASASGIASPASSGTGGMAAVTPSALNNGSPNSPVSGGNGNSGSGGNSGTKTNNGNSTSGKSGLNANNGSGNYGGNRYGYGRDDDDDDDGNRGRGNAYGRAKNGKK